jgi:hypothetical protein
MRRKWIVLGPLALLGIAVVIVIGGGSVMLLWNWLLPMLFGWPQVTFWQALGLLALCRMLFGHWAADLIAPGCGSDWASAGSG